MMRGRIIDRVAMALLPRACFLLVDMGDGQYNQCPRPKWRLCCGKTWADLYTIEMEEDGAKLVLHLDNPFSRTSVFSCGTDIKLASDVKDPPKDSLQFLAARAMAAAWDQYDEATQQLICDTVTL